MVGWSVSTVSWLVSLCMRYFLYARWASRRIVTIFVIEYLFDSTGSAVSIECIFSGGCDTISLRHASLQPDTIRTLMLVKQQLRLARTTIQEILGD
jgi:hypothetical protein